MNKRIVKPLMIGSAIIAVLLILNVVLPAVLPASIGLAAYFLTLFLAIMLAFVFFGIFLLTRLLNGRVPRRGYMAVEYLITAGILIGVVGLFQPWSIVVYKNGFYVLGVSLACFMIWAHISPKTRRHEQEEKEARAG
jgi:hypothetical protein